MSNNNFQPARQAKKGDLCLISIPEIYRHTYKIKLLHNKITECLSDPIYTDEWPAKPGLYNCISTELEKGVVEYVWTPWLIPIIDPDKSTNTVNTKVNELTDKFKEQVLRLDQMIRDWHKEKAREAQS